MYSLIVEIRSGEGGDDAKMLVKQQLRIYTKYAKRMHLRLVILSQEPSFVSLRIKGKRAREAFAREAGGHRVQRVPPNEKRGRRSVPER